MPKLEMFVKLCLYYFKVTSTKQPQPKITDIRQPPDFTSFFKKRFNRPLRTIKKRTLLFSDGDYLDKMYFIQEGFVKLYRMSDEGKDTIAYLYGPGYVVGLRALLSIENIAKHNAESLTDLKVMVITHKEYFDIIGKNPVFLSDLIHYFMDRLEYTEKSIEMFVSMNVRARIAHFFLDFAENYHITDNENITFPLTFTHQMIADLVGSSRETVTLSMNRLKKRKIISDNRGKIKILDIKRLRALSLR